MKILIVEDETAAYENLADMILSLDSSIEIMGNTESGDLKWEYDTGEQIVGSPAVIKDHFFILTAKGTLFCFGKGR